MNKIQIGRGPWRVSAILGLSSSLSCIGLVTVLVIVAIIIPFFGFAGILKKAEPKPLATTDAVYVVKLPSGLYYNGRSELTGFIKGVAIKAQAMFFSKELCDEIAKETHGVVEER